MRQPPTTCGDCRMRNRCFQSPQALKPGAVPAGSAAARPARGAWQLAAAVGVVAQPHVPYAAQEPGGEQLGPPDEAYGGMGGAGGGMGAAGIDVGMGDAGMTGGGSSRAAHGLPQARGQPDALAVTGLVYYAGYNWVRVCVRDGACQLRRLQLGICVIGLFYNAGYNWVRVRGYGRGLVCEAGLQLVRVLHGHG